MPKKPKIKKGPARMRQLGRTGVVVWLSPLELAQLDKVRGEMKRASWCYAMVIHSIRNVLQFREKP